VIGALRREWANPISRSGILLLVNTAVTGVLGLAYWLLAARLYPLAAVGQAGALVSASTLLSGVGQLNLSGMLMRFLPDAHERSRQLVLITYGVACASAVALTIVGAIAISLLMPASSALRLPPVAAALFIASVAATVLFTLQDSVLVAVRKTGWIPVENGAFGVAKLVLLVALVPFAGWSAIFASWMLPLAATVPVISWLLFRRVLPRRNTAGVVLPPLRGSTKRQIRHFVLGDASAGLFTQTWTYLLPVIIAGALGAKVNALFYASFLFSSTLDQIASNFSMALVVEGARRDAAIGPLITATLRRVYVVLVPAVLVFVVLAPEILSLYGHAYTDGTSTLRLLALACLPKALLFVYYGTCRIKRQTYRSAVMQGVTCACILGGTLTFGSHGLEAIALVVLFVQVLAAAVAVPQLARSIRPVGRLRLKIS
jgi:O-antigen/teichoic acid export membrane protein